MPARAFPNIRPSSRRYTPGNFPQTEFRAQNGALTILRYGNKRVDSTLSLEFRNILDSEAKKIIDNYINVNSDLDTVTFLDTDAGAGISDAGFLNYIKEQGTGLSWRYAGPPQITSTFKGRSTVVCEFIGVFLADD
jgi:hypothetical protein